MRKSLSVLAIAAAATLVGAGLAPAITNGALDGTAHPAIGFMLATDPGDICTGNHQFVSSCSVTLIDADLTLTSGDCADGFAHALTTGLIDQVWVIFDENPVAPSGSPYDCAKFIDVDEAEIVANPDWISNPSAGANLGVMRLVSPLAGVTPVQLPPENRLQNVPRKANNLTAVATGGTTIEGDGYRIFDARRRSSLASTNPPLQESFHDVTLATGGSPAQACFGYASDGGAVFLGDTNEAVSLTRGTFGPNCSASSLLQRLDVQNARDFLDDYVTLP